MIKDKIPVKVGDKVIANDEYHSLGFIDGEVIEVNPYKGGRRMSNEPSYNDNKFGVTILGRFKYIDFIAGKECERTRNIYSCDFKINPIFDVNVEWSGYDSYAKALFFTSQKIKDDFNEMIRNKNMEHHLAMAKSYGYNEKQNKDI
jgi:hypothetical protein